jgi:hypothetical protein
MRPGVRGMLRGSAIALAAGGVLYLAPCAGAAPSWLSPASLSAAGASAEQPLVALDPGGDGLTVWTRPDSETAKLLVEVSARPAGAGPWQPAQPISDATKQGSEAQVALDAAGDALVVWLSFDGSEYSILSASRPGLTGAWQAPVTIKNLGATTVSEPRPDLAVNAAGDAVVVWERPNGAATIVEAAIRTGAGGSWAAPETLSETAEGMHPPEVGIDATGAATAVWEGKAVDTVVDAAERPPQGKWEPVGPLSKELANEPRIAVAANGDAVVVWERLEEQEVVEAVSRPGPKAAWGTPVALTKPETGEGEPAGQQVAIDGAGRAVVAWSRYREIGAVNHDVVEASVGDVVTSAWQKPVSLSSPAGKEVEEQPQVGVDEAGAALVVWEQATAGKQIVEAASGSAANGIWGPAVALSSQSPAAGDEAVALDAQGDGAAVWRRFDGSFYRAEAAGFDDAGPTLRALVIPTSGVVGQPLRFSVSPFDVWSALGGTSWSLGDGSSLAGTSVTHTYATPGTYTVTVSGSDALANTSSAGGVVSIAGIAPRITRAALSHRRFRVSRRATAVSARAVVPLGTSFRFTLSEAATVEITLTRPAAGLRSGKHCVVPTRKLRARHAGRCSRTLTVGTLSRSAQPAGVDSIAFSGRIGRRALAPGAYHATLTAATAGLASAPLTLALTVVR